MLKTFLDMLVAILSIFKIPFFIVVSLFLVFFLMCTVFFVKSLIKGQRLKKGTRKTVKQHGFLRKLFIDAPKQVVSDMFARDPDFFKYQGLIVYEGRQGYGKTISMIRDVMLIQEEYPLSKCITNLDYEYEDDELNHWKQLVDYKNGILGVMAVMDETQNWFSSNQSKNFPPEMLQVITQNRKNRRVIFGTAQSFNLLAKAIRTQCTEVRKCITLLGCITIVRRKEPDIDSEGYVISWHNRGWYWFVHDEKLRSSYDTYKVVNSLSESGFQDIMPETNIINNVQIKKK